MCIRDRDIYDDSMWLINLVENLLSVTRLEEGRLNLRISAELADEVVTEALRHVNRLSVEHHITVNHQDDLLLAKMDAKLIVQVIINLVDNAIKYTPQGSEIQISTFREENWAVISVADNGPGIPDENKKQIFDMFYTGSNRVVDSRRSLGLGLSPVSYTHLDVYKRQFLSIYTDKIQIIGTFRTKDSFHFIAFILAEKTVIHEYAGKLAAYCF